MRTVPRHVQSTRPAKRPRNSPASSGGLGRMLDLPSTISKKRVTISEKEPDTMTIPRNQRPPLPPSTIRKSSARKVELSSAVKSKTDSASSKLSKVEEEGTPPSVADITKRVKEMASPMSTLRKSRKGRVSIRTTQDATQNS